MRRVTLVLLLVLGSTAARADTWSDLWATREQQAQQLLDSKRPAEAAPLFADPRRRAFAELQAGQYAKAAEHLAPFKDAESQYNRGNALAHTGQLKDALAAYDAALKQSPGSHDVVRNRDLVAQALKQQSQGKGQGKDQGQPNGGQSGQGGDDKSAHDQGGQKQDNGSQSGGDGQAGGQAQPGDHGQQGDRGQQGNSSQADNQAQSNSDRQSSNAQQGDSGQRGSEGQHGSSSQASNPARPDNQGQSDSRQQAANQAQGGSQGQPANQSQAANQSQSGNRAQQAGASNATGNTAADDPITAPARSQPPQTAAAGSAQALAEAGQRGESRGADALSAKKALAGADAPPQQPRSEQALALDQWLRGIPEDSGELLRRKFMIEHMMKQQGNEP